MLFRSTDRPIRPLFAAGWRYETQVIALLLSADTENDSDVLAITGASAALAVSSIPFQKTIAGVRVGMVGGQFVINPTFAQRKESTLDLVVAGSMDGIVMVEAGAKQVSEEQVVEAFATRLRRRDEDREVFAQPVLADHLGEGLRAQAVLEARLAREGVVGERAALGRHRASLRSAVRTSSAIGAGRPNAFRKK